MNDPHDISTERSLMGEVAQKAALPFTIVENFGIPCGYERSFKMRRKRLLANRYMLGVNTKDVTEVQLRDACRRMQMPRSHFDSFLEHLSEANLVLLGFEHDDTCCTYKIYLEFWEKLRSQMAGTFDRRKPTLLHLGFKWDTDNQDRKVIARYTCYPRLAVTEIVARMRRIYQGCSDHTSLDIAEDLIQLATSKTSGKPPIYLEAAEEGNSRVSFDINLYRSALRMSELRPQLSRMHRHFDLASEDLRRLDQLIHDRLLGHVSGGLDRNGNDFLTVYYEM